MPIEINIKKDVQEALTQVIAPILEKIEKFEAKYSLDLYRVIPREEVAKLIGVERPETVDKLARENKLNYVIINGRRRYRAIDVLNFLKQGENKKSG